MNRNEQISEASVRAALRDSDGKIGRAARKIGLSRRGMQNRMRFYGIARGRAGRPRRQLRYRRSRGWMAAGAAAIGVGVALLAISNKKSNV